MGVIKRFNRGYAAEVHSMEDIREACCVIDSLANNRPIPPALAKWRIEQVTEHPVNRKKGKKQGQGLVSGGTFGGTF
jgi:hypothetical protein